MELLTHRKNITIPPGNYQKRHFLRVHFKTHFGEKAAVNATPV